MCDRAEVGPYERLVYKVADGDLCFPRWRAFRRGNSETAIRLLRSLGEVAGMGVYGSDGTGRSSSTFSSALLPALAEAMLRSAEFMLLYATESFSADGGSEVDVEATFGSPRCAKYVELALKESARAIRTATNDGRPREVHPAVVPCVAPLLARRSTETESMLYDFDGIRILADKVLLPIDRARETIEKSAEEARSANDRVAPPYASFLVVAEGEKACLARLAAIGSRPCYRIVRGTFTCAPTKPLALATAFVFSPDSSVSAVDSSRRRRICRGLPASERADEMLVRSVDGYLRQAHQPGWSVANVISSGMRGGFVGDRRKKKRAADGGGCGGNNNNNNDDDGPSSIGGGSKTKKQQRQQKRVVGRMTARRRRQQQQQQRTIPSNGGSKKTNGAEVGSKRPASSTSSSATGGTSIADDVDGLLDVADELAIGDPKTLSALAACRAESEDAGAVAAATAAMTGESAVSDPLDAVSGLTPKMWSPEPDDGRRGEIPARSPRKKRRCEPEKAKALEALAKSLGLCRSDVVALVGPNKDALPQDDTDGPIREDARTSACVREMRMLESSAAKRNFWVDARATGGRWSRERFPCGCTLSLLAELVLSTRRRTSIDEAAHFRNADLMCPSSPAVLVPFSHDPFAVAAVAVDLLCGTASKASVEESRGFAAAVAASESLFSGLARDASELLTARLKRERDKIAKKIDVDDEEEDDDEEEESARRLRGLSPDDAESRIRGWVAGVCFFREKSGSTMQSWSFARVTRFEWAYQARNLALATGMYGRADEIAASAARTRFRWLDGERRPTARPSDSGDGFSIPTAALAFEPPNGWPCDVAYAVSLAADAMRVEDPTLEVGDVIPLADSTSVVVLPDRGCRCGKGIHAADGADAYVAGAMAHIMGSGEAFASDCAMVYPFAVLVLLCASTAAASQERDAGATSSPEVVGGWKRRASKTTYANCAEPKITGRRNGWDALLWSAVAFASDAFSGSLTGENGGASSSASALPPLAKDPGRLEPEDELFCEYRLLGKMLVAAMGEVKTPDDVDAVKRGFACVARPKSRWSISLSAAKALLDLPQMADGLVDRLRQKLQAAVAALDRPSSKKENRGIDDAISLTATESDDDDEVVVTNVSLVSFVSTIGGAHEAAFLKSIALESTSGRPGGSLLDYDVATIGSPVLSDSRRGAMMQRVAAFASRDGFAVDEKVVRKRRRRKCTARSTESGACRCASGARVDDEDDRDEAALYASRIPELSRMLAAFVEFYDETLASGPDGRRRIGSANAAMRFVADSEAAARAECAKRSKKRKCEYSKAKWMSADALRVECVAGWKRLSLPLAVLGCTGQVLRSDAFLPVADNPMSNPFAYPATCCGCHRNALPRIAVGERDGAPAFSECFPYKHGPLMSEIVHAGPSGIRVLRHAHPPVSDVRPANYAGGRTTRATGGGGAADDGNSEKRYASEVLQAIVSRGRGVGVHSAPSQRRGFGPTDAFDEGDTTAKILASFRARRESGCPCLFNDETWLTRRAFGVDDVIAATELAAFERDMAATATISADDGSDGFSADRDAIAAALACRGREDRSAGSTPSCSTGR